MASHPDVLSSPEELEAWPFGLNEVSGVLYRKSAVS